MRAHVSGTMDGSKGESIVDLDVATGLIINHPHSPWVQDLSVHGVDPGQSSGGGHGSVHITRKLEHPVFSFQGLPDPLGTDLQGRVIDIVFAHVPGLDVVRDVQGGSHICSVQVVSDWLSVDAGRGASN